MWSLKSLQQHSDRTFKTSISSWSSNLVYRLRNVLNTKCMQAQIKSRFLDDMLKSEIGNLRCHDTTVLWDSTVFLSLLLDTIAQVDESMPSQGPESSATTSKILLQCTESHTIRSVSWSLFEMLCSSLLDRFSSRERVLSVEDARAALLGSVACSRRDENLLKPYV